MSLLMLKTKNLSWQDHTLNIEAMLAPLRSTLLMNKHKTLDTKCDQEKALYQRQRDACIKDFVVEKRLIERRRQKILNRKKEIMQEIRSQSALEHVHEKTSKRTPRDDSKERSFSAPSDRRLRGQKNNKDDMDGVSNITSALPRLALKHTPLFGDNPLRPRLFLETGMAANNPPTNSATTPTTSTTSTHRIDQDLVKSKKISSLPNSTNTPTKTNNSNNSNKKIFITGDGQQISSSTTPTTDRRSKTPKSVDPTTKAQSFNQQPKHQPSHQKLLSGAYLSKPPKTPTGQTPAANRDTPGRNKRIPNVTFLGLLNNEVDDDFNDNRDGRITVEVKQKTVEDKVRDFLKELDAFNSRPPTALGDDDDSVSVFSSVRSRDIYNKQPLVANRYQTLTLDKKLLEKAFDRYIEHRSHDDLLKAMKLAAKMKAHIRQARNTSLIPTMAAMKSSRTFLKLLKRQQRREKQAQVVQ